MSPDYDDLVKEIVWITNNEKPKSVKELAAIAKKNFDLTEEEIVILIMKMQAEHAIEIRNQQNEIKNFWVYLLSNETVWYWLSIAISILSIALFFLISETAYPFVYARNIVGLILVLFLPGFACIRMLFPINASTKLSSHSLELVERIALSIGMSAVLVSIVGLLIYYSPWGLNLSIVVLSLFCFTSLLLTGAVIREYVKKK